MKNVMSSDPLIPDDSKSELSKESQVNLLQYESHGNGRPVNGRGFHAVQNDW